MGCVSVEKKVNRLNVFKKKKKRRKKIAKLSFIKE